MITSDVEQRVIALSDAAGRATCNGLPTLAEKLEAQAQALLSGNELLDGFERHTVVPGGFRHENGGFFRGELYTGTVVYIKRSR